MMKRTVASLLVGMALVQSQGVALGETHAALGSRVSLSVPINPRYAGSKGALTLTDGTTGVLDYGSTYLGFEGQDVEVTVSLPLETHVHCIAADFLQNTPPGIFLPVSVDIAVSENGENFRTLATLTPAADEKAPDPLVERFQLDGLDLTLKAVRIRAGSGGTVPAWHRSPQALRWIFISEVLVNPGDEPHTAADLTKTYVFGSSRWPLTTLAAELRQAEPARQRLLCDALRDMLMDAGATPDARRFCLDQISLFGDASDVEAVASLLAGGPLAAPACRVLAHLGGDAAAAHLQRAATSNDPLLASEALQALGILTSPRLLDAAAEALQNDALRPAALRALADVASPAAMELLTQTWGQVPARDRPQAAAALLSCGNAMLTAGDTDRALAAFDRVLGAGDLPVQRVAALAGTVRAGRTEALMPLLAMADDPTTSVRRSVLTLGEALITSLGPDALTPGFENLPVTAQVVAIRAVEARSDTAAAPWLRQHLTSTEITVRVQALQALSRCGEATDVPYLVEALGAPEPVERDAAADTLRWLAADGTDEALTALGATAAIPARAALCGVYANRGLAPAVTVLLRWTAGDDRTVRREAWNALETLVSTADRGRLLAHFATLSADVAPEAEKTLRRAANATSGGEAVTTDLVEAFARGPSDAHRICLLALLGETGNPLALTVITDALASPSLDLSSAAIRACATWPDAAPLADLFAVAEKQTDERISILALRTGLEMLGKYAQTVVESDQSHYLDIASRRASRQEERDALIQTAAGCNTPAAVAVVLRGIQQESTVAPATAALLKHALDMWPFAPRGVFEALQHLAAEAKDEDRRTQAAERLKALPEAPWIERIEAAAWRPLFNGTDLSGWRIIDGKPDAWGAEEGLLVARAGGGGWLARDEALSDYMIEFEFRLPADGNSGLFLRPPLEGNPAWEGIEVQLLDDAAPMYANLRGDQYCGSIYGIAAAEPRVSRQAGEWQRLRALCAGRRVDVWLNGTHVAAANLDDHMDKQETIRGLTRQDGFPGLQNEHGPIEFRSLRLKSLAD